MKPTIYLKLQKKFGGKWVSTSKSGEKVYAAAKSVHKVFDLLKKKNISPQKTVVGYIEKYGQISAYLSLPV